MRSSGSGSRYTLRVEPDHPIELASGNTSVELRPKERTVVLALVLHAPDPIDTDELIATLWPDDPPASARQSLHNHLARLRRLAPDLVVAGRRGYVLDDAVTTVVEAWPDGNEAVGRLPDLVDTTAHARLIDDFRRRRVTGPPVDLHSRLASESHDDLVASLEVDVDRRPHDERGWWQLMVVLGTAGRVDAVHSVLERARTALADVGLEPGRRLIDVDRLVQAGVTDIDQLANDPFGRGDDASRSIPDLDRRSREAVRRLMRSDEAFVIEVVGEPSAARTDLLERVIHEGRVHGFDAVTIRFPTTMPVPPEPRRDWSRTRPGLIGIDDAESGGDLRTLIARLRTSRDTRTGTSGQTSFVVTTAPGAAPLAGALRIEMKHREDVDPQPDLDLPAPGSLELAETLVMLDEPATADELDGLVFDVGRGLQAGLRSGVLRLDMRTSQIDLASSVVRRAVADRMTPTARSDIARRLFDLELPHESAMRRAARRARLAEIAHGSATDQTLDLALEAIEEYRRAGDLPSAIVVALYVMDAIERARGRTRSWCRLALLAGRFQLATGEADGDQTLLDIIDAARELDDDELLSHATHELCRLGHAATAGRSDPRSAALISSMLDEITGPANRARVGAAAAMVYSFVNEPDRLRAIFEEAERDARAAGDDELLIDVLPLVYMSLPLPSDVERRISVATELLDLGERYQRPDATWEGLHLRLSTEVMTATGDPRSTYAQLQLASAQLHERSRDWEMHYVRSNIALLDGDLAEARRHIDESLAFGGDVDESRVSAVFGAHHLAIASLDGSVGAFVDVIRQLVEDQPDIGAWKVAFAAAAAASGALEEATSMFESLIAGGSGAWALDHTYTPALISLGEAAVTLGRRDFVEEAIRLLEPLAGTWSWCGSCTFGPIDLTLARLRLASGEHELARRSAAAAIRSAAALRAPRYVSAATAALLAAS